jgi:uncharacterized protein
VTPEIVPGPADDARALRAALRQGLTAALKARDPDALAALRTAIAAIDNAEAVPVPGRRLPPATSAHIAGARSGPGSTEAARQRLEAGELRDILRGQVAEYTSEADRYDALGQADAAQRLRRRARVLTACLVSDEGVP